VAAGEEVFAVGRGAYWAVGTTALAERSGNISLVAHYADGHWQQVGFEGVGPLFGVAATGPDDVWAVGQDQDPGHVGGALILHFDRSAWAAVEPPATAAPQGLSAVIALPTERRGPPEGSAPLPAIPATRSRWS
jgi:hypothetical protein